MPERAKWVKGRYIINNKARAKPEGKARANIKMISQIQQYKITVGGHPRYFKTLQEAEEIAERYYRKDRSIVGIEYADIRGQMTKDKGNYKLR